MSSWPPALLDCSEPPCKVRKCEPDLSSQDSSTPPPMECDDETAETLRVLVMMGADVNGEDDAGLSPLSHAALRNDIPMIRTLVRTGADINYDSRLAGFCGRAFIGGTALHQAAMKANPDTVKELLCLGAQVNFKDSFGKTPLHWAASEGRLDNMMVLVAHGGDLNATDSCKRNLLHIAAKGGQAEVVHWLLARGTDPKATCSDGTTPLHDAAIGGHIRIIELLLSHMQPDCKDILGRTPLMCAVRYGKVVAAKQLLKAGAMTNWSPIDLVKAEIALI